MRVRRGCTVDDVRAFDKSSDRTGSAERSTMDPRNTALATGAGGPATSRAIAAVDAGSDGAVRSGDMAGGALRRIGSTAWADGGRTAAGVATVSGVLSASRARASRVSANGMMGV